MSYLESLFSLSGRQALVTGAARGNGKAVAEALARAGAVVLIADRDGEGVERTVHELAGLNVTGRVCDLADDEQIEGLVADAGSLTPNLGILVNNAGVTLPGDFRTYSSDNWELTHRVNLRAPFLLTQRLVPLLERSGDGVVINVTSLNAELAFPGNPAYVAFKGALRQLTKAMALDLAEYGIRVNALGPGYIRTAMTAGSWDDPVRREDLRHRTILGRWGVPDDLAGAAVFLASRASAYVTGLDLYVDGGWLAKGL